MTDGAGSQRARESQQLLSADSIGNDHRISVAAFERGRVPDEQKAQFQ